MFICEIRLVVFTADSTFESSPLLTHQPRDGPARLVLSWTALGEHRHGRLWDVMEM